MLLMDLSPKEKRNGIPFIAVFGLLIVAITYVTLHSPHSGEHVSSAQLNNARPIGVEERQTVVFVLDQLENDQPKLATVIRDLRLRVVERPTFVVEREMTSPSLVWNTTEGLLFSFRFFSADLYTQSNSLLRIIDPGHMHLVFTPDALVKLPE